MRKVTEARARNIREDLFRLVDNRLIELGCDSLMQFARRLPGRQLFDEPRCPFVNVLCPDDLCYLPADHVGTKEGFHITNTVAYDYAVVWAYNELAPVGTTRDELIERGAVMQGQMRLDEIDGMG